MGGSGTRYLALRFVLIVIALIVTVALILPPLREFAAGRRVADDLTMVHRLVLVAAALIGAWNPDRHRSAIWVVMIWSAGTAIFSTIGSWEITDWTGAGAAALLALSLTYPHTPRQPKKEREPWTESPANSPALPQPPATTTFPPT